MHLPCSTCRCCGVALKDDILTFDFRSLYALLTNAELAQPNANVHHPSS